MRGQISFRHFFAIFTGLAVSSSLANSALAGGFEIREQSAFFSGTAYAGTAAGGSSLSSIFWNPATSSFAGHGITTDSNYAFVLPRAELHADSVTGLGGAPVTGDMDVDIGRKAIIPASYMAWRYNDRLVFALSTNSAFGLTTKPDNVAWAGSGIATTSKLFSINATPSFSYQLTPNVSVGAGLQMQYVELKHLDTAAYDADADDFALGAVAGINITPFRGTSIGVGYRSRISHDLKGKIATKPGVAPAPFLNGTLAAELDTPDKVTFSFRQELNSRTRLLGSVEWTNWSILGEVPVMLPATPPAPFESGTLVFNWKDGWSYSLGGEYDVTPRLTVRAGITYEESPIQQSSSRLVQLPDSNRIWFGLGASYAWSDKTTINVSYLHVELEEERFSREALTGAFGGTITGTSDVSADAISVGLTMRADSLTDLLTFK